MRTITIEVDDDDAPAIEDVLTLFREHPSQFVLPDDPELDFTGRVLAQVCRGFMDMLFLCPPSKEITCIGCGCKDNSACDGGCSWLAFNSDTRRGVCSNCETHRAAFEAEQRVQEFRETLA